MRVETNMSSKEIAFRVDCGTSAGFGHLVRSFALAQKVARLGYSISFFVPAAAKIAAASLLPKGYRLYAVPEDNGREDLSHLLRNTQIGQWIIVDSYTLPGSYYSSLHKANRKLFKIDDFGLNVECADVVLNSNFFAKDYNYSNKTPSDCRLLLGPEYHPIRDAFWSHKAHTSQARPLIIMGGSDPAHATLTILEALSTLPHKFSDGFDVVIGPANNDRKAIAKLCNKHNWLAHINPANIAELMAQASAVITAAGSTTFEALLLNKPMILLVTAENQQKNAEFLQRQGLATLARAPQQIPELLEGPLTQANRLNIGAALEHALTNIFSQQEKT